MTETKSSDPGWRRPSYSGTNGNCVEAAASGRMVMIRDSKDPYGTRLVFGANEWQAFAAALKVTVSAKG
jgi:hypothetical protein